MDQPGEQPTPESSSHASNPGVHSPDSVGGPPNAPPPAAPPRQMPPPPKPPQAVPPPSPAPGQASPNVTPSAPPAMVPSTEPAPSPNAAASRERQANTHSPAPVRPKQSPARKLSSTPTHAAEKRTAPIQIDEPRDQEQQPKKKRVRRRRVATAAGEQLAQQDEAKRKVPSWLVSFIFHVGLLLVLALIPIQDLVKGPLTLVLGGGGTEGDSFELQGAELSVETEVPEVEETASLETTEVSEILQEITIPDLAIAENNAPAEVNIDVIPFGIREGLSGRTGPLRDALLAKFGGSAETEEAVELGLQWLVKQQKSDGSWSLQGPYSDGGSSENKTAATAMAVNAFLGAGYTHQDGKYRSNVDLGLKYLIRRQNSEGFFSHREPSRQQMYAQAIASISVIEAFGMTEDEDLRSPAMKAVAFAEWSQSPKKGWRYEPRGDSDLSVTGWFLMALQTARMAGLPVDNQKIQSITEFIDSVSSENDTRYAYNDFEAPSLSMTAEGLLCRIYLGWTRTDPALLAAIKDDILPRRPALGEAEYSVYYWYYATQVMHHVGGTLWDRWNEAMKATIPAMQERAGREAGSWSPSKDAFGASGGRLYVTCLNIYCLEVYYRHLALYDLK